MRVTEFYCRCRPSWCPLQEPPIEEEGSDCFDEFEYYFGADFLTPMILEESMREEYYYNIKILKYGEDIHIHLYYKNEI